MTDCCTGFPMAKNNFLSSHPSLPSGEKYVFNSVYIFKKEEQVMIGRIKNWTSAVIIAVVVLGFMHQTKTSFGNSLNDEKILSAEWWQWAISIPMSVNPVASDTTGKLAMVGQHGKVWFLAGSFSTDSIVRNCIISEDHSIFFPIINSLCSVFFGDGTNEEKLRTCAKNLINLATVHEAFLDGKKLKVSRRQSPLFMVSLPPAPDNIVGADLEPNPSASISDGYWAFIKHLSVGEHIITMHGKTDTFEQNITYNVKVVPAGFAGE